MIRNDRRVAIGGWVLAGLPILVTFFQAVIALLGVDALNVPLIGGLKETVDTITIFDVAGDIFRDNDVTVFALFILVALSWLAVGGGMLVLEDRQFTYAAAGLVTVFLVLFFLVYSPLFREEIPVSQIAGFVSIPVLTVGAIWLSVTSYEWTVTLKEETAAQLGEAREHATRARTEFEQRINQEVETKTVEWLEQATPAVIEEFEETTEAFYDQCAEIEERAEQISEGTVGTTSQDRLQRATQLRDESRSLEPTPRATEAIESLRSNLAQNLRSEFGQLSITSPYGTRYRIRNMGAYNKLSLTELHGPPVQIGGDAHELGDRLADEIVEGRPLSDVARAVDQANKHIDELVEEVRHAESQFEERLADTESLLSDADDALSRIDPLIEERLREILFEKRFGEEEPPFPTEVDVRERIDNAKADLHDCRLDRALRTMDDVRSDAARVKQIAVFFTDSVVPTIEHGAGSIPIPSDVGVEVVEQIQPDICRVYDVSYTIENDELLIERGETGTEVQSTTAAPDEHQRSDSGDGPPPEDVMYLLRELRRAASNGDTHGRATIQLGEYPDKFSDDALVEELASFCSRQNQIVEIETPDSDPGYITIVVSDEESASRVLSKLCDRYTEQYG